MNSDTASDILAAAQDLLPWMIEIRRDLHQHPELGLEEHRTNRKVRSLLDEMGIEYVDGLGGTGVLGLIRGDDEGRVVALRADMDALPIQDDKDVAYASKIPGKMHACGHDVHTAVLLGAARLLVKEKASLPGTIKLLFQPAEETVGGAKLLIEAGALENPRVDAIFGLHVDPTLETGTVGLHFGQRNASSDNLEIIVHGKAAHGAYPYEGADAIVAAAQVISSLQTIVSRNVDAQEAAVVSLGTIRGGSQANIVADRVELVGTVRCASQATRQLVLQRIKETAEAVALGLGARAEVNIEPSYDPVVNNDSTLEIVRESSRSLLGDDSVVIFSKPNMGVEDFGYYLSEVPGAFYSLGVRNEAAGIVHPVHQGLFDVDESAMAIGVALQVLNALAGVGAMLNKVWGAFFFVAFAVGLTKSVFFSDWGVWAAMVTAAFDMSKVGFEISLGLTGIMCLWLGIMRLGEKGGAVDLMARAFGPLLKRLFPGIPDGHPAMGSIVMNMAANMLGLDNAATPLGLKAMGELQELNPEPEVASNDQILFLVLNTSAVTVIPATIFVYRAQMGAADPTDVFIPMLIATFCSTMVGLTITAAVQRLRLWDPVILAYLGGLTALVAGMIVYFSRLDREAMQIQSSVLSNFIIFSVIVSFVFLAARRGLPLYDVFVEGAKDGFKVAVSIIPYLVAMLVAIGIVRASGALDFLLDGVRWAVSSMGLDTRWVDGLPTALMRPLSGSGARGLMLETMEAQGADSFAGRLVSVIQGSTETTFYVLAVYFGSVGIRRTRHALPCGLAADAAGAIAAILVCYLFFG